MTRQALVIGIFGLSLAACSDRGFDDFSLENFGDEFEDDLGSEDSTDDDSPSDGSTTDEESTDDEESTTDDDDESTTWEDEATTESTESTDDDDPTAESSTDGEGLANGAACTTDDECMSNNCYVVPFLGGQCGECNEDSDCPDGGCTPPNPFETLGSVCNVGELGGGCESSDVCMPGLLCGNVLDLLGLIQINSCGTCADTSDCPNGQICAPLADITEFSGINDCILPGSLPQDAYCLLEGNGNQACDSGVCSVIDIMGLAEIGACGECNTDLDCGGGTCVMGEFDLEGGNLTGSLCQ